MRWLAIMVAGCSFPHHMLPDRDASSIADGTDAPADSTSSPNCYATWLDHTVRFQPPTLVDGVNTSSVEADPYLSPDELTIYFSSNRSGSTGYDIWTATRMTIGGTFSNPVLATPFNSSSDESKASLTGNGLIGVVASNRSPSAGDYDVWEASRLMTSTPWPAFTRNRLMAVETSGGDYDPMISDDGLHLYTAPGGPQHIWVASRQTVNDNFGASVLINELSGGTASDADPALTKDERVIVFRSYRTLSGFAAGNLWYATRASATATFATPLPVPDLNTDADEGNPHVSADGCHLYFTLAGDIWVASVQ